VLPHQHCLFKEIPNFFSVWQSLLPGQIWLPSRSFCGPAALPPSLTFQVLGLICDCRRCFFPYKFFGVGHALCRLFFLNVEAKKFLWCLFSCLPLTDAGVVLRPVNCWITSVAPSFSCSRPHLFPIPFWFSPKDPTQSTFALDSLRS